jgi:hypothetical protein
VSPKVLHLEDTTPLEAGGGLWTPLRRLLGVTSIGINAYSAREAGDEVIERHDERSPGAGGHEEIYLVLSGRAKFVVDGEEIDAPPKTLLLVEAGLTREAVAAEPETMVLVLGGKPGAALPTSPFEHWYAAEPAYARGDYEEAIAIASQGLTDWPLHPLLHYQLACYRALAGDREQAVEHLRVAFAGDGRTREWAAGDEDLASVREDPRLAPEE